jgi:hypothetical protein
LAEEKSPSETTLDIYLDGRWKSQCDYFERAAAANQKNYMRTRIVTLIAISLTPLSIAGAIIFPKAQNTLYDFVPLVLSILAIASYQWEELFNYGPKWAKFRLVAERLKGHRELFLQRTGMYRDLDDKSAQRQFVEYCEGLIEGTDVNYFVLMVDPRRRDVT